MAVEFVGATTASTTGTSVSTGLPAGTRAGDVLVLLARSWHALRSGGPAYGVVDDNWTLRLINAGDGNNSQLYIFTGVANPTDQFNPLISFAANGNHLVNLLAFRGVDPVNSVNKVAQGTESSGTIHITPAISGTIDGSMIVRAVCKETPQSGGSCSWAAGTTRFTDSRSSNGYAYLSTSGAINGTDTVRADYSGAGGAAAMAVIALSPKPASRLNLGSIPVPLMLGNTEVTILGP